jgi:hypothetical protein
MTDNKIHRLNSSWTLWYHNPNDSNWDMSSYNKVMEVNSLETFWNMFTILKTSHFQNGMFFLMKNNIKPMWEDKKNVDGGCWSFRVTKKDVPRTWQELVMSTVGEVLMKESKYSKIINGISISPKRSFSIIKIWNNNIKLNESSLLNEVEGLNLNEIMFKPHVESIDKDKEKRLNRQLNELNKEEIVVKSEEIDVKVDESVEENKLEKKKPKLIRKYDLEDEDDEDDILMFQQYQSRINVMLQS